MTRRQLSPLTLLLGLTMVSGCDQDFSVQQVQGELAASPLVTDLGAVPVGATERFDIQLDSVSGGDIQVLSVDILNVTGEFFSIVQADPPIVSTNEPSTLELIYKPTEEGWHRANLSITSDADPSIIAVDVRAQAIELNVTLWPLVLDFGNVAPGETVTMSLTAENASSTSVLIDGWSTKSPRFSLDGQLPLTLEVGAVNSIDVTFEPQSDAPITDYLTLSAQGAELPLVTLRGNDCDNGDPSAYDLDEDGYATCGGDCDDSDDSVRPGGTEVCDGLDNDCDDTIDEGTECYDDDGDGFTELEGDCNDGDYNVSPGVSEIPYDGIDNDCDGVVDGESTDKDGDGYGPKGGDCDDLDANTYPGAPELPDGVDNDCDGIIDEGTTAYDDDGDGYTESAGDCDDTDASIYPSASELADFKDNDCDGTVDEGTVNHDDDGDGYTEVGGDCDDSNASIHPGAADSYGDSIDQNCDGSDG